MSTRKMQEVLCHGCNINFLKDNRYVNAAIRKGRNHFCSLSCQLKFMNRTDPRFQNNKEYLNRGGRFFKPLPEFRWYFQRTNSRNRCNLLIEDIRDQWEKQNGLCAVSGLPIKLHGQHTSHFDLASLDRIDSSRPYEVENIQFIALPLNLAKQNQSNSDFIEFIQKLKGQDNTFLT